MTTEPGPPYTSGRNPSMARRRIAQWIVLVTAATLPLLTWPVLAHPFSTPKRWMLVSMSLVALVLAGRSPRSQPSGGPRIASLRLLAYAWLASWVLSGLFAEFVSFDVLLTGIAAGLWALA